MLLVNSPLLPLIFLCLVLVSLISMCLGLFLLGFILYGTLCASCTRLTISFSIWGKFSTIISLKNFLIPFLFLFFFWDCYNSNVSALDIVPEVSETILSSFHSFYFICSSEVISTVVSSKSLISSSASDILLLIPSRVFLISVIVSFVSMFIS